MVKNDLINNPVKHQITITRIFDAPVELVFSMWTNPEYLSLWWGPKDFTNPVCKMDVKEGGAIQIVMQAQDGTQIPVSGLFNEIQPPNRLVFTTMKVNEQGDAELEVLNTIIFIEENGKTKMMMKAVVMKSTPEAVASLQSMETGWNQSIDKLAALLLSNY